MRAFPFVSACLAILSFSAGRASGVEILDWAQEGGHTYYLLSASDWFGADAAATRLGGHLVTIDNQAENTFLLTRFAAAAAAKTPAEAQTGFWIGLSDENLEGTWTWSSGSPLNYANWWNSSPRASYESWDFGYVEVIGVDAGLWKDAAWNGDGVYRYLFGIVEVPSLENLTINPPVDLLSWWPGENTAWDVVGQAGGFMKNAATGGQAAYAPGKVGRAFSFDGVDDHVEAADAPGLDLTGDFTIEGWINYSGVEGEQTIISKRNPDNNDISYVLFVRDGTLTFASRTGGGEITETSGSYIPLNQWVHVAVTLSSGQIVFYYNGIPGFYNSHPVNRPDTTGNVTIGASVTNAYPTAAPWGPYSGRIDELSLYGRALTPAEIDAIYWVGAGGKDRHDPARDFSPTANPNGPWSFDYFKFDDPSFSGTLPAPATEEEGGKTYRYSAYGLEASLVRSYTDRHITTGAGGTEISASPRQFRLHPSFGGMGAGIRWTAPEPGRFAISGTFTGSDAQPTTTRIFLYRDNTTIFPAPGSSEANSISSYLGDGVSVTRVLDLEQGDQISWLVDTNGNHSYDNTGAVFSVARIGATGGGLQVPTWDTYITTAEPYMTGRNWHFHARNESRPDFPDMIAWVQYSAPPGDPGSWTDLGQMGASGSLRFILDTSFVPVGSFAFRIKTSVPGGGTTYSEASPIYNILEAEPFLETELDVSSHSDPSGETTHRGDFLKYTLRFRNSGAAPYEALKARIVYPRNTTTNFPAHLALGVADFTLGGQRVSNGEDFAWEWNIPSVRPVGQVPYGEARNTFKTVTKVVKGKKKKVSVYDKTFFAMPNDPSHGFENGDVLRLHRYFTTPLPSGLMENKDYFVVNATAGQFQIAATSGGAPLLLTGIAKRIAPLHFKRTNEWQTRTISFRLSDPTLAEEQAAQNAGLPTINAEGGVITARARVLTAALSEVDSITSAPTTIVNPLSLTIQRVFQNGPAAQGDLVTFNLIAKNNSSERVSQASVTVSAPRGLSLRGAMAFQGTGDHPVFLDASGQPSGAPIDPATNRQVVRPASWKTNPELLETEIPGPSPDSVPSFVQQARFYFGAIDPGEIRKMRFTCKVQYDWDTESDPEIMVDPDDVVFAGKNGSADRRRNLENEVTLDIVEAAPGSAKPEIAVLITQQGTGTLPGDRMVATVGSVQGLSSVPQVEGSSPQRGINELVYRATYANYGEVSANFIRLWMQIPEGTEYVKTTQFRSEKRFRTETRKGKKVKVPYIVRIPYTVESARIIRGSEDTGEIPVPKVVGGGTWFTCLVPSLASFGQPGWVKTLEFRVKLKPGIPVGTRINQPGGFATSRELFYVQAPVYSGDVPRDLVAEVVTPANMNYLFDEDVRITKDGSGNPTGYGRLVHRAIYHNRGGISATGVGARYTIPYGFTFRDARYVNTNGNVVRTTGITKPSVGAGGGGEVVFNTGTVAAGGTGIAEVVLDYDPNTFPNENSLPIGSSRGGLTSALFRAYDDANPLPASGFGLLGVESSEPLDFGAFRTELRNRAIRANVPRFFVGTIAPSQARPGEEVTYRLLFGNYSSTHGDADVNIRIPVGTTFVRSTVAMEMGGGIVGLNNATFGPDAPHLLLYGLADPNGSVSYGVGLPPHSCVAIDFTVLVNSVNPPTELVMLGPAIGGNADGNQVLKSPISCREVRTHISTTGELNKQVVFEKQLGGGAADALGTAFMPEARFNDARNAITVDSVVMAFGGTDLVTVPGRNLALIPLGGGNMVAAGGGNLVGNDGASLIRHSGSALVAAGGGNMVAAGAGNLLDFEVPGVVGRVNGQQFFAQLPQMVAAGGGNIFDGGGLNLVQRLIGNDGSTLIGMDGSTLVGLDGGTLSTITVTTAGGIGFRLPNLAQLAVPPGLGRMVAAGGGNLVAAGGGNMVAAGGGNMVAAGGGNLVAAGGGNILSTSKINFIPASNVVPTGAGRLVAAGGGNLVGNDGASAVPTNAGNMVAAGGGNLVAAGGGNVIHIGAGMVAAGGGN